jgi:rod shape determining protein RodA
VGLTFLIAVLILGVVGKGAQRWLDLKIIRFQPSEVMKLAIPLIVAWYFDRKPLPPTNRQLLLIAILIFIPVILTAKQPDLGTAVMLAVSGVCVLFLSGIRWRLLFILGGIAAMGTPILWFVMHDYQRQRVLTFLDPERDPLGAGYHIIQSKIAIGSGGLWGKGWMHGTQSQLDYLPEHTTDFIFAVLSEEFGLIGVLVLLTAYLLIVLRCLFIGSQAQTTFGRLLVGSLSLTFFFSYVVNIGMVSGILPVVGVPLPLVSYGGTSMLTVLASFGLIMSVHTHRKLIER